MPEAGLVKVSVKVFSPLSLLRSHVSRGTTRSWCLFGVEVKEHIILAINLLSKLLSLRDFMLDSCPNYRFPSSLT